ncbi:MAG: HAD family hydrolase [Bacteroidales bacterium]|nr:HAD family hydrolase [Bacteroidales bacterium]
MKKAVFLDRDGVINYERGKYNLTPDDFVVNDGVGEAIALLKQKGYMVIVISNQGALAKKLTSFENIEAMHLKLADYLKTYKTSVDEIYYCPHHQDITKCLCRKPLPLMIEKAMSRFNIDKSKSFMIGDAYRDVEAAELAGIKAYKIDPNSNLLYVCNSILRVQND